MLVLFAGFGRGGGLYNTAGTVTVENSTFQGNLARGGSNTTRSGTIHAMAGGGGLCALGTTLRKAGSPQAFRAATGMADTSRVADPQFRNVTGGDYAPLPGSPAAAATRPRTE